MNTLEDFYRNVHELRMTSGDSIAQIADRAGMTEAQARSILTGRYVVTPAIMHRLLRTLGLSEKETNAWVTRLILIGRSQDRIPMAGTTAAQQAARLDLSAAESELTDTDELTLPALWKVTHARLDYYHEIATGQARQSFRNAQIAMGVGFALLVVFAVLALLAQSTAAAVVTGALGATSAAFAAYISRTFVRSQETAATHLRSYFDQPLEFSRYLAAERLLNGIERLEPEQRATITTDVLRGIVSTPSAKDVDKPAAGGESA